MKAPQRFIQLISEGKLKEVKEWLIEASYGDCDNVSNIRIETDPRGEYQGDGEYCLQYELSTEMGYYAFEGTYYHKIKGQEKYIAYDYYLDA